MLPPGKPGDVTGVPAPANEHNSPETRRESLRSDVPLSKKCSRSASGTSRVPDTPSLACCVQRSTSSLTQAPRPGTGGRGRPAGRPRATFRSERPARPERRSSAPRTPHTDDQPAAGACPRPGSPAARVDRRSTPSCAVRCGLHSTLVRTTQEPLYLPGTAPTGRRPEARAAAPRGAPSHPADDRGGPP